MIDTFTKRVAAIGAGLPWRLLLPAPDGELDEADRYAMLGVQIYGGGDPNPGGGPLFVACLGSCSPLFMFDRSVKTITGINANGFAPDLSEVGEITLVVINAAGTVVQQVVNDDLDRTDDGRGSVGWTPNSVTVSLHRHLRFFLRTSDGGVVIYGQLPVLYAPPVGA